MYDIAYEVEASICVSELYWFYPIPKFDIVAAHRVMRYINAFQYWSIMYFTHGV